MLGCKIVAPIWLPLLDLNRNDPFADAHSQVAKRPAPTTSWGSVGSKTQKGKKKTEAIASVLFLAPLVGLEPTTP